MRRLLPPLCLAIYTACCLSWASPTWRPAWDDAVYILTAQSLARGDGYTYLDEPFYLRPPGVSWIVSATLEEGRFDPRRLNLIVMSFAAAAVIAIYLFVRHRHGSWPALAVALLSGTSPLYVDRFNRVLAEFPFLSLIVLGALLLSISTERDGGWWRWSLAGSLCLGLAFYMRTAAILILPGLLLLARRRKRPPAPSRALLPAILLLALAAPWWAHARRAAATVEGPTDQLLARDYAAALLRADPSDPDSGPVAAAEWSRRARDNGARLLERLTEATWRSNAAAARLLFVGLVIAGLLVASRRASPLDAFFVLYTLLLLAWMTFQARLLLPLLPMIYLYIWIAIDRGARRVFGARRRVAIAIGALAVTLMLASNVHSLWKSGLVESPGRRRVRLELQRVAAWVRQNTPDDAVLLCREAPSVSLLSGRRAYTFKYLRPGLIERYGIDYVVFDGGRERPTLVAGRGAERSIIASDGAGREVAVYRIGER